MVSAAGAEVGAVLPRWTSSRARAVLVLLHVPFVTVSPVAALTGIEGRDRPPVWFVVALAGGLLGLQLRHSLAAARGRRPEGWPWSFGALLALVYLPMLLPWPWLTWNWAAIQWLVVASAAMLLRGRWAVAATVGPIVVTAVTAGVVVNVVDDGSIPASVVYAAYWVTGLFTGGAALYGAARLVQVLDELHDARHELADLAVGRERLRLSRDLHDLLGHSLSAVSLKGDLAMALLDRDAPAARAEIDSLTTVARSALREMRAVTHDEHVVSLATETDAAAVLLGAAGIEVRVDLGLPTLRPPAEEVLAWAVREGATNLLRHSDARDCTIVGSVDDRGIHLEILNDGARGPLRPGTGISGLTQRAAALHGTVTGSVGRDGRFRLRVDLPESALVLAEVVSP